VAKKASHTFNIGFTPKKNVGRRVQQKLGDKVITKYCFTFNESWL